MSDLTQKQCIPCSGGVPPLAPEQAAKLLQEIAGWSIVEQHHLSREFGFTDFAGALAFVNRVGEIAESAGHHPDIYLAWGRVRIEIWTHAIDGLTESDFILAAKIDASQ